MIHVVLSHQFIKDGFVTRTKAGDDLTYDFGRSAHPPLLRQSGDDRTERLAWFARARYVLEGMCECGSARTRIADPLGRTDDVFDFDDSIVVHPHLFRAVLGRPGIADCCVRQTERGAQSRVVSTALEVPLLEREIAPKLSALGLCEPAVTVEVVSEIERLPSGKLLRFLSRRATP